MHHLPDERILLESNSKSLRLTTHRVRYHTTSWGSADLISIMLDEVSSCAMIHRTFPLLFVIAGIAAFVFIIGQFAGAHIGGELSDPSIRAASAIVGVLCVVAYFLTRTHVLSVRSPGDAIRVRLAGMKTEEVGNFVEELEAAKNARFGSGASPAVRATGSVSISAPNALSQSR
jgi:hypothetical protein